MTDATTSAITIHPVSGDLSLYHHYPRQSNPQDAYIALDTRDGVMWAGYNAEIGNAVPMDVWHGLVRRYGIPPLHAAAANALMEELRPLAERVVRGSECVWDGSNHKCRMTADAEAAEDEIDAILDEVNNA